MKKISSKQFGPFPSEIELSRASLRQHLLLKLAQRPAVPEKKGDLVGLRGAVLSQLQRESMSIDGLSRNFSASVSEISGVLSFLELEGMIYEEQGNYYVNQSSIGS